MAPRFMRGFLHVNGTPADTYLATLGFTKGYIWANGVLLGRYWDMVGPQHALYLPAPFLSEGDNEIVVLELSRASVTIMNSVAAPDWSTQTASVESRYPMFVTPLLIA